MNKGLSFHSKSNNNAFFNIKKKILNNIEENKVK